MGSPTLDRRLGITGDKGMKAPVDVATTANIVLSGEQVIDGILTSASRVLVKNQTDTTTNGYYDTNTGPWTRCIDANNNFDLVKGTLVRVSFGTQSGTYWYCNSGNPVTIGTSAITFLQDITNTSSALAAALASNSNAAQGPALVGYSIALAYAAGTVGRKLRDIGYSVRDSGAVGDGVTDDTAAFNAAILAATLMKANVLSQDETYSVVVSCEWGKDYKINGPVLLPSGIVLDLKGSRLIGAFASGISTAYVNGSASVIETGYYSAGAITTNRAAAAGSQRVVGAGVMNGSIINANCALNLINFNERSFVSNIEVQNSSAAIRTTACFYASFDRIMVRNSAQAANQYAILLGAAANAMVWKNVFLVGCSRGFQIDGATVAATSFIDCSFEGAYVTNGVGTVDGTGIYISGSANSIAGLVVEGCYFEAVRWGIQSAAGGGAYGASFIGNIFNSCNYAMLASASAFRVSKWLGNSCPDGGGIIRNLVDFGTAIGNEVDVQIQVKTGQSPATISAFLSNVVAGNRMSIDSSSFWDDTAVAGALIAVSTPGLANKNSLNAFAWEGGCMVTKGNQVPFAQQTIANATITLDFQIPYDISNFLLCHMVINDNAGGPYLFDAIIVGSAVYPLVAFSGGKGITVSNNAGNVRLVFTGLNTNSGASYNITGGVRHA